MMTAEEYMAAFNDGYRRGSNDYEETLVEKYGEDTPRLAPLPPAEYTRLVPCPTVKFSLERTGFYCLENAVPSVHAAVAASTGVVAVASAPLPNGSTVADIGGDGSKPCGHRDAPCATAEGEGTGCCEMTEEEWEARDECQWANLPEGERLAIEDGWFWMDEAQEEYKRRILAERELLEVKRELEELRERERNAHEQAALNIKGADIYDELAELPAPERAKAENEQLRIVTGKDTENEPQVRHDLRIGRIGRMKGGLTQAALAKLCGVHKITVSKWERKPENAPIVLNPYSGDWQYSADIRTDGLLANAWARLYCEQHGKGAGKRVSIEAAERERARDCYTAYAAGIRAVGV